MLEREGVGIFNPKSIVLWNSHKKYLLDLQAKGVDIPKTTLVERGDTRTLDTILNTLEGEEFVVKPCYGASAHGLIRTDKKSALSHEKDFQKLLESSDALIQEFVPEIKHGEYSAIFIGGKLSHVVLKKPKEGEYRSQYEHGGTEHLAALDAETLTKVKELFARCDVDVLYARLDFVITPAAFLVMELELIEPYLFFDLCPEAADEFARCFNDLTKGKSKNNI